MIVSFETRDLYECCCRVDIAEQRLGALHAQALATLIADVEAFDNAADLINFFDSDACITEDDSLFLPIGSDYRAKFVVAGTRFQRHGTGRVDWTSVHRLKLTDISRRP